MHLIFKEFIIIYTGYLKIISIAFSYFKEESVLLSIILLIGELTAE